VSTTQAPTLVFAGSGTAGHLYPGVRIASDLVEAGLIDSKRVVFVGAGIGTGRDAVEAEGFSYRVLEGARPLRGKSPLGAAAALAGSARSFLAARHILAELSPSAVVGIGGYASFPVLAAAASMGIAVTVLQLDATFGLASGAGILLARSIPVAFPATYETFQRSRVGRAALYGGAELHPVRPCVRHEIEALAKSRDLAAAKKSLGLDSKRPLVVFLGGSLGAGPLNDAAFEASRRWADSDAPQVVAVTGMRYFDQETSRLLEAHGSVSKSATRKLCDSLRKGLGSESTAVSVIRSKPAFVAVAFVARIESLYAAADVVVSRAGAATVGELAASGTPSVLMPSSYVAGDHQRPNAEALARCGAAVIAYDSQAALVPSIVERLLERPQKLEAMRGAAIEAANSPHAAYEVVAEIAGLRTFRPSRPTAEAV
jgi:UDP-N-acetylglucosamine--N-acetylmuramyl-(pentapeptide) pyrophosphoryl-undecaprenol N-acetylglucosamine transferase